MWRPSEDASYSEHQDSVPESDNRVSCRRPPALRRPTLPVELPSRFNRVVIIVSIHRFVVVKASAYCEEGKDRE
jgi:hypothetical protein